MKEYDIKCPFCDKNNFVKKNGTKNGKQRFLCSRCKKTFLYRYDNAESLKNRLNLAENENLIIDAWANGNESLTNTANKFGISLHYLRKIIKQRYKLELEELKESDKYSPSKQMSLLRKKIKQKRGDKK